MQIQEFLRQARPQIEAVLGQVEVEGKGVFVPPLLDLDAIKLRADELDPKSQIKADIYMLLIEVEKCRTLQP